MAVFPLRTTLIEKGVPRQLVGKAMTRVLKETMAATAIAWHDSILPLHFEPSAEARYNYRKRSAGHIRRKKKRGIHEHLVWKGNLRNAMTTSRAISSTRLKSTLTVKGAHHLHFHDKQKELARLADDDIDFLQRAGNAAMQKAIDSVAADVKEQRSVVR